MTVWKDVRVNRMLWLVAATLVLGSLIGAGAGLLTLLLYGVEHVMLGYVEGAGAPGPFAVPAVRRAVSVTVGLSLAGLAWWLLRTKTTKVPSVKKAVAGERMPWWQTVVHVVLQIFIVGSGASIGREVAPRELGAMLAQRFCDLFHIGHEGDAAGLADRRMVVAVAAGAGLGGVYDAPLAGMFFAVEILLADVTLEKVGFALGMSATAAYVASLVKGRHTFYAVAGMTADYTPSLMLFALLCGVACGAAGALFRKGSSWATAHQPKGAALLWQMPLAGFVTGLIAVFAPQVMGNGRAAAQLAFDGMAGSAGTVGSAQVWSLVGLLAVTFLVKAATTLATIRSGASGGVLQPGIALGAALGATLGILWSFAFPGDPVGVCALIGAAALLSASQQAPLMAMCLVMELTEAPITLFVPVGLAVAVSAVLSHRLLDRSVSSRR
ncbi:chloride channel protein [Bifidobacterium saguinibicoloris]|uniref:chloride channel protein n=1 Tax=Bifidobacterium saguinibicoloris TaxID=2834433 RepID=UPI001C55D7A0|nr:chloride channel protein [Bifidobacterium saguinibicoloris]MBW3080126.1 chloride channel protein [Bifidobacterium saguinibicoloris]